MSEGAKNAKINVLIFDKPYPTEKTAMMRAVNWAILTGACYECRHRRKCSIDGKFKFPKRAPCVKKKAEYLKVKKMDKKDGETSVRNFASPERMAEIANNALDYIGEIVGGSDLYGVLSGSLGMSNEEILASGFTTLKAYMEEEQHKSFGGERNG